MEYTKLDLSRVPGPYVTLSVMTKDFTHTNFIARIDTGADICALPFDFLFENYPVIRWVPIRAVNKIVRVPIFKVNMYCYELSNGYKEFEVAGFPGDNTSFHALVGMNMLKGCTIELRDNSFSIRRNTKNETQTKA